MKEENRQFLEDNRHHWITLTKAQYLKHLNDRERSGMQRVMSEEFQPGYATDLWCPPCVSDMILLLYRKYDEFLDKERMEKEAADIAAAELLKQIVPPAEAPLIVAASFPKNDPPADKPNSPKNKRK